MSTKSWMWILSGLLFCPSAIAADTSSIAELAAREMASWRSIELRVTENIEETLNNGEIFEIELKHHYVETSRNKRFYDRLIKRKDGSGDRKTAYSDGRRCALVVYDSEKWQNLQKFINIDHNFFDESEDGNTSRPAPIRYWFVGKKPLFEAIEDGKLVGHGERLGRQFLSFAFDDVQWASANQNLTYDIDVNTSLPIRVTSRSAKFAQAQEKPLWVWSAQSIKEIKGYHMPISSLLVRYSPHRRERTCKTIVTEIHYNKEFPDSFFWPVARPGTQVNDAIQHRHYVVPPHEGSNGRTTISSDSTAKVESDNQMTKEVAIPLVATQPSSWQSVIPLLCILVGLAMLFGAVVVWHRRRS